VSTAASCHPSKSAARMSAVAEFGARIRAGIRRHLRSGRDRRMLQTLPDSMLADIGLEKVEILSASNSRREVWVIPHKYY
jgi:uncharacterized protein YjiS (DUF1127 family)